RGLRPLVPAPPGARLLQCVARRARAQLLPHVLHGLGSMQDASGVAIPYSQKVAEPADRRPSLGPTRRELHTFEPRHDGSVSRLNAPPARSEERRVGKAW